MIFFAYSNVIHRSESVRRTFWPAQRLAGTEGSNPLRSAIQSVMFTYNLEIAENSRVTGRLCARCEPESAHLTRNSAESSSFSLGAEKPVRFTDSSEIRSSIACVTFGAVALVDSDRLQLRRPFQRQLDPVEQSLSIELRGLASLADHFDDARCCECQA
jgi:hypothetical protein